MTAPARKATNAARTSAVDAVTTKATDTKATDTKATDTKATESKAAKVSRSAPLDLSALTVADAPAPKVKGNPAAGRKKADNSVAEGWLRESWENRDKDAKMGKGKAVTVPTVAVGTLKSRLNMAAATLSLGVAIQTLVNGDTLPDGSKLTLPTDQTRVVFAAKVRKAKRTKATPAAADSAAPAAEAPAAK